MFGRTLQASLHTWRFGTPISLCVRKCHFGRVSNELTSNLLIKTACHKCEYSTR